MRWPIRNQILLPLISIQILVVMGVTWLAAWSSLRRVEAEIQHRFRELTATIQQSTFPLTEAVLKQMHGLSGAEFVIQDADGRGLVSTLDEPLAVDWWQLTKSKGGSESVDASKTALPIRLRGVDYLALSVFAISQGEAVEVLVLYPGSLVESARYDAVSKPILLGLLMLILSTVAVILVASHIGKRIQEIERQVARVAEGNFEPIPLRRQRDELRDLSASVNQMSVQLNLMTAQIRETERAQLVKQLAGGIAHQLRNSLTGARLALQLHRRRCPQAEEESLDVALRQMLLTEEQIRGLVALIRDEHRPQHPGRLTDVIRETTALVSPMCEHRQIRFEVSGDLGELHVADADQMRAALLNLCINAIEATSSGGLVRIDLTLNGNQAIVDVSDDGPGIPADRESKIFTPFQTSKPDGMGLGLALVKQIAEDHAGTVSYQRKENRTILRLTCRGDLSQDSSAS